MVGNPPSPPIERPPASASVRRRREIPIKSPLPQKPCDRAGLGLTRHDLAGRIIRAYICGVNRSGRKVRLCARTQGASKVKKHLHLLDHLALPTTPGQHHDGGGLYLVISPTGAMSWVYRYKIAGVERRKGLGAYPAVGLAPARKEARRCRDLRDAGIDPVDAGKADRAADKAAFLERIAGERAEREAARQAEERETADRA